MSEKLYADETLIASKLQVSTAFKHLMHWAYGSFIQQVESNVNNPPKWKETKYL
jgi:hypothetical protein